MAKQLFEPATQSRPRDHVTSTLAKRILSGAILPGNRLPPESELGAKTGFQGGLEPGAIGVESLLCGHDGLFLVIVDERQQCVRQAREVPVRDVGLVAVGVTAAMVDGAEHRVVVETIH